MKQTLDIVDAIEAELARLEELLAQDAAPGAALRAESQIKRMRALISDLKREIELAKRTETLSLRTIGGKPPPRGSWRARGVLDQTAVSGRRV